MSGSERRSSARGRLWAFDEPGFDDQRVTMTREAVVATVR